MFRRFQFWFILSITAVLFFWLFRRLRQIEYPIQSPVEILVPQEYPQRTTLTGKAGVTPSQLTKSPKIQVVRKQAPQKSPSSIVLTPPLSKADDLRRVHGIGTKIAALLQTAGINTFTQLAEAEISELRRILEVGGVRAANPETWPAQAKLASKGDWQALQAFKAKKA